MRVVNVVILLVEGTLFILYVRWTKMRFNQVQ